MRRWLLRPVLALAVCVSAGGVALSAPAPALAAEAPKVEEQWVTHVSATAVTLEAKVNPEEVATTYKFEYATSEAALLAGEGEITPAPPASEGEAGAGTGGVVVEEHPQDLQAHTNYWYRVVARNGDGKALGCEAAETCKSFTTRVAGGELELPDGRAWELVSPPPGSSGDAISVRPQNEQGVLIQAAQDGGAITYQSITATEAEPAGESTVQQILSAHGADGWFSRDIATPHHVAAGFASQTGGQEYRFFSSDLSVGLVEPPGSGYGGEESAGAALLSPGASEKTLYVRADPPLSPESAEQGAYDQAEAEGGYRPLVTGCPVEPAECRPRVKEDANVPPGTVFGEHKEHGEPGRDDLLFDGATPDLSHVVFYSQVPLSEKTPAGQPNEGGGLYGWAGGQLQLISVLPDGEQEHSASLGSEAGHNANARGAISSDGSHIVWSNSKPELFMRDVSSSPEQTVRLDEVQGGSESEPDANFEFANSDGSKVFFTDTEELTETSTAASRKPDLYECEILEVGDKLECKLSDLTVDPGGHATVRGMVAVGSEEDSDLYFVANGVLTSAPNAQGETAVAGDCAGSGNAEAGQTCNLYLLHYDGTSWATTFITSLSGADKDDWGERSAFFGNLGGMTSGVSPDGEYLAFMSELPLTGYDNRDASSGELDEEVYLYQAPSAGEPSGRLVCASCNPTGERPTGVLNSQALHNALGHGPLIDAQENWSERWLAASIPSWTAYEEGVARYQSRYLSNGGRLFFDSPDALVPQATNGLTDVYEYEPAGVGGCEASSVTFSDRSDGCVGLISSGSSGEESAFLDAGGKGPGGQEAEDVFFESSAQLVAADTGSALAVYDAHVCSAAVPCPTEAASPSPCATEASCKPAPTPQPAIFGPGPSETFSGAGNPAPPPPAVIKKVTKKTVKCKRGLVKDKKGKCVRKKSKKKAKRASRDQRTKR